MVQAAGLSADLMPGEKEEDAEHDDHKDAHEDHVPGDPALENGVARVGRIDIADRPRARRQSGDDASLPSISGGGAHRETVSAGNIRAAGGLELIRHENPVDAGFGGVFFD